MIIITEILLNDKAKLDCDNKKLECNDRITFKNHKSSNFFLD